MSPSSAAAGRLALAAATVSRRILSGSLASTSVPSSSSSSSVFSASFSSAASSARQQSSSAADDAAAEISVELDDPSLPPPSFLVGPGRAPVVELDLEAAIAAVKAKASPKRRFDESIDAAFVLGIDPRRGDHAVRGAATLPAGTGKQARVAVFVEDDSPEADAARAAGASVVGGDSLVSLIAEKGSSAIEFDRALATAAMMPKLAKVARVLGPRGLMPNPKLGTVISNSSPSSSSSSPSSSNSSPVAAAVAAALAGRVDFRADKGGVVHAPVGKASFEPKAIASNVGALADALLQARPKALKGGGGGGGWSGYIKRVALSTTQGKGGVRVSLPSVAAAAASARAAAKK